MDVGRDQSAQTNDGGDDDKNVHTSATKDVERDKSAQTNDGGDDDKNVHTSAAMDVERDQSAQTNDGGDDDKNVHTSAAMDVERDQSVQPNEGGGDDENERKLVRKKMKDYEETDSITLQDIGHVVFIAHNLESILQDVLSEVILWWPGYLQYLIDRGQKFFVEGYGNRKIKQAEPTKPALTPDEQDEQNKIKIKRTVLMKLIKDVGAPPSTGPPLDVRLRQNMNDCDLSLYQIYKEIIDVKTLIEEVIQGTKRKQAKGTLSKVEKEKEKAIKEALTITKRREAAKSWCDRLDKANLKIFEEQGAEEGKLCLVCELRMLICHHTCRCYNRVTECFKIPAADLKTLNDGYTDIIRGPLMRALSHKNEEKYKVDPPAYYESLAKEYIRHTENIEEADSKEIASLKSQVRDLTRELRESNDENAKLKNRLSVTPSRECVINANANDTFPAPSIAEESQLTEGM